MNLKEILKPALNKILLCLFVSLIIMAEVNGFSYVYFPFIFTVCYIIVSFFYIVWQKIKERDIKKVGEKEYNRQMKTALKINRVLWLFYLAIAVLAAIYIFLKFGKILL